MNRESIIKDLMSFADEKGDVEFELNGHCLMQRNNETLDFWINKRDEGYFVQYKGIEKSYMRFLADDLADLDNFANKIVYKREFKNIYIPTPAEYISPYKNSDNNFNALEYLENTIDKQLFDATKIVFITAEGGVGKTYLLKKMQYDTAKRYLNRKSHRLVWHIELQGRELIRLNEALMYDLADLRIPGLYYDSIITLIRNGLLVLAIDGFDELAAEINNVQKSPSSLTYFINQMEGTGIVLAASRTAYFNTIDFTPRRTKLENSNYQIDELKLASWKEKQVKSFIKESCPDDYNRIIDVISNIFPDKLQNPLISKPFLLLKILETIKEKQNYFQSVNKPDIANLIDVFVEREATKWGESEKETGTRYLTKEQHIKLLSEIASEMWLSEKETLEIEEVYLILQILMDEWKISELIKPKILTLITTHALLSIPKSNNSCREFYHEEYRLFFLSKAIHGHIAMKNERTLAQILSIASFPTSIASYIRLHIKQAEIKDAVMLFISLSRYDWKQNYLKINIGTVLPSLLNDYEEEINIGNGLIFTSDVFEGKRIINKLFENCHFLNIQLINVSFENIVFKKCEFTDLNIYDKSYFNNVNMIMERINCLSIFKDNELELKAFSPKDISRKLVEMKWKTVEDDNKESNDGIIINEHNYKLTVRFLNKFLKSTRIMKKNIENETPFGDKNKEVLEKIVPICLDYKIIHEVASVQTKQSKSEAWVLSYPLEEILDVQNSKNINLLAFWKAINAYK